MSNVSGSPRDFSGATRPHTGLFSWTLPAFISGWASRSWERIGLYFDVNDLDTIYARAKESDVQITRAPETYPWGMREFNAVDLNGYNLRFGQHMGSTD